MQLRQLIISLMFLLLCPGRAGAVLVEDLYQGLVPVADHSAGQLSKATSAALAQVLVKVSGSGEVLGDPEVVEALGQARSFVQQYRYLRPERDSLALEAQFDPQLVNDILAGALLPLWTANRPAVLVWLVVDDAAGRSIATRETHPEVVAAIESAFRRRGVPVEFPLYDLQDTLAVSVHELWQLDGISVYRASRRYQSENVLVGRLRPISGQRWMGDWLYLWEDLSRTVTEYGEPLESFVGSGVQLAADAMGARYAVAPTGSSAGGILVRVEGLQRYADYRAALEHLNAVELVEAAVVEYVAGSTAVFRVSAQISAEQLQRVIGQKRKLQSLDQFEPLDAGLPQADLVFRWTP